MKNHKIIYGSQEIEFGLERKKVKNVYLKVKKDASVTVTANKFISINYIMDFVKKKALWIIKQIEHFKKIETHEAKKEFVSGESVKYLGRQYRLKVEQSKDEHVKLNKGYVFMSVSDKDNYKLKEALFNEWLRQRAIKIFKESLNKIYDKVQKYNIPKPNMNIRLMKSRWGSCITNANKITLNLQLIKAPKSCIEYVILHELAHFKFHKHDKNFYNYLSTIMPDWKERKKMLDEEYVRDL